MASIPGFYFDAERNRYFPLNGRPPPAAQVTRSSEPVESKSHPPRSTSINEWLNSRIIGRVSPTHVPWVNKLSQGCVELKRSDLGDARMQPTCLNSIHIHPYLPIIYTSGRYTAGRYVEHAIAQIQLNRPISNDAEQARLQVNTWRYLDENAREISCSDMLAKMHPRRDLIVSCSSAEGEQSATLSCIVYDWESRGLRADSIQRQPIGRMDVWAVSIAAGRHSSIALGSNKKAVLLNLDRLPEPQSTIRRQQFRGRMHRSPPEEQQSALIDRREFRTQSDVLCVQLSYDAQFLSAGCRNGIVAVFDTRSPARHIETPGVLRMKHSSSVHRLQNMDDGRRYLLSAAMNGELWQWDTRFTAQPVLKFEGHVNSRFNVGMAIDEDLKLVACMGSDRVVRIWSLDDAELVRTLTCSTPTPTPAQTLAFLHNQHHDAEDDALNGLLVGHTTGTFETFLV